MPDLWMDVDAALSEVPVNIFPLTDDTDFKTREVSITYDQAGMDLVWNFVTPAGAFTQTAVTPTTAGDYDWAHAGDGMYTIEIPASGGASINNDTEGFGWFSGYCTGVLPWRGPVVGFRASGLNDLLIESAYSATRGLAGTALPAAAADAAGGLPVSDTGGLDLDNDVANQIQAYHLDHLFAVEYDPDSKPGAADALLNELVESDVGVARLTANALEQAPSGSGATAQEVWEYDISAIATSGYAGTLLTALGYAISERSNNATLHALLNITDAASTYLADAVDSELTTNHGADSWTGGSSDIVVATGAVDDVAATTLAFVTDLTEATNDHYNGLLILFTSGDVDGQARWIEDYNGSTKAITVSSELVEAPADEVTFKILAVRGLGQGAEFGG